MSDGVIARSGHGQALSMIDRLRQLDPVRFNRCCKVVALVFLLGAVQAKLIRQRAAGQSNPQDWPQYYMAALVAQAGAWDALYPIPTNDVMANPGEAPNSVLRPRAVKLAQEHGVDENAPRFMQPPPMALLLWPLAWLDYWPAYLAWTTLLCFAAWGIALQAGEFHALCAGRQGKAVGLTILLVAISPQAFRWARVGNMSVILGWLIGRAVLDLARGRDGIRPAIPLVLGAVAKYVLVILVPLHVVTRRWRTLMWSMAMGFSLLLASYWVMGPAPFRTFVNEIVPTLKRTTAPQRNMSLHAFFLRNLGMAESGPVLKQPWETVFRAGMAATLLAILALVFPRPRGFWQSPSHIFAAAVSLVAWAVVFSPIFWEHYHAFFAPFWGWLIWQGTRSAARLIIAILAIGTAYMPALLIPGLHLPEPLYSHLLWSVVIMMLFGMWVMWSSRSPSAAHVTDAATRGDG
jgi:hypothetical protein